MLSLSSTSVLLKDLKQDQQLQNSPTAGSSPARLTKTRTETKSSRNEVVRTLASSLTQGLSRHDYTLQVTSVGNRSLWSSTTPVGITIYHGDAREVCRNLPTRWL